MRIAVSIVSNIMACSLVKFWADSMMRRTIVVIERRSIEMLYNAESRGFFITIPPIVETGFHNIDTIIMQ